MEAARGIQDPPSPDSASNRRVRVTQACDQCRLSRRKCDSNHPSCYGCVVTRLECTYTQKHKKRGKPTGYIWALEVVLALLVDEEPANAETIRDFVAGSSASRQRRESIYNEKLTRQLHEKWRNGETVKDIHGMLAGDDPPPINYKPRGLLAPEDRPEWITDPTEQKDGDSTSQWPLL